MVQNIPPSQIIEQLKVLQGDKGLNALQQEVKKLREAEAKKRKEEEKQQIAEPQVCLQPQLS